MLIAELRNRLRATMLARLSAAGALHSSARKVMGMPPRTTKTSRL